MKYILLISTLMFSAGSWAEWTVVAESSRTGARTYVDFDRIRKVNGLVYYWQLRDYLEPNKHGVMSTKLYHKADCETMREWELSFTAYKLPMAEGTGETLPPDPDPKWDYAQPDSILEGTLQAVCAH